MSGSSEIDAGAENVPRTISKGVYVNGYADPHEMLNPCRYHVAFSNPFPSHRTFVLV
jgi:hypothetical protein